MTSTYEDEDGNVWAFDDDDDDRDLMYGDDE